MRVELLTIKRQLGFAPRDQSDTMIVGREEVKVQCPLDKVCMTVA
jgi:hypothetical protein